jgi:hypothetical protein
MLKIGSREYSLVLANSGLHVSIQSRDDILGEQRWRLDAHYIPEPFQPPLESFTWEYLRLGIWGYAYRVDDWRELGGFGFDSDSSPWLGVSSLENLIDLYRKNEVTDILPGDLTIRRAERHLFHCEFDGVIRGADGTEQELFLCDQLPFASVSLPVPINASDPIKTARSIVARELKLTETCDERLTPYDWRRTDNLPNPKLNPAHQVTLDTPWRLSR